MLKRVPYQRVAVVAGHVSATSDIPDQAAISPIVERVWAESSQDLVKTNKNVAQDQKKIDEWGESGLGKEDIIGKVDEKTGRIPLGFPGDIPITEEEKGREDCKKFQQVTIFGSSKSFVQVQKALTASSYTRKGEELPAEVERLADKFIEKYGFSYGNDLEDSAVPSNDVVQRSLKNTQEGYKETDKTLRLPTAQHVSKTIVRVPGIDLYDAEAMAMKDVQDPSSKNTPVPLNIKVLTELIWKNRHFPDRLIYYVPKIRTVDDMHYLTHVIDKIEEEIVNQDNTYKPGQVKLQIVIEDIRAICQVEHIIAASCGRVIACSLGWHDCVASTAEVYRKFGGKHLSLDDQQKAYSMPTKMLQQEIVTRFMPLSQQLLGHVSEKRNVQALAGMYGILYSRLDETSEDFESQKKAKEVAWFGLFKEIMTQHANGTRGSWLASPVYSRITMALVQSLEMGDEELKDGKENPYKVFEALVDTIFPNPSYAHHLKELWHDLQELRTKIKDERDNYLLAPAEFYDENKLKLIGAMLSPVDEASEDDIKKGYKKNNDEVAVKYNISQAFQYLLSWFGKQDGAVALPTSMKTIEGELVRVRAMDDLATTRRSLEEVFAEIYNLRLRKEDFVLWLNEEFTRLFESDPKDTSVLIKKDADTEKWYTCVKSVLIGCMTNARREHPLPDLLIRFLKEDVSQSENPWETLSSQQKDFTEIYGIPEDVQRLDILYALVPNKILYKAIAENLDQGTIQGVVEAVETAFSSNPELNDIFNKEAVILSLNENQETLGLTADRARL